MRRIFGAAFALAMMVSMTLIASAQTGSVEVRGHIVGIDQPVAQYRVTYHANGGWGSYNGPYVTADGADTVCSLFMTGITRSGYWFTGWNTRSDGGGIWYATGDSITLNGDVILYAQWRKMAAGGSGGTRPSGGGWTLPWSDGTTTVSDGDVPLANSAITPSGGKASPNPYTGVVNNIPLCVSLLCISLAVMIFLLWTERREKRIDAREP